MLNNHFYVSVGAIIALVLIAAVLAYFAKPFDATLVTVPVAGLLGYLSHREQNNG